MAGAGGGRGACGSLLLLGLCCWTGTAALGPVRDIKVETQTNTSISLRWTAPEDLEAAVSHTYWVQWDEDGAAPRNQSTNDTRCTAGDLQPATQYRFTVWAEQGANSSQTEHKIASTAPNPVGKLTVEAQTSTSISLSWTSPGDLDQQSYTYWVRWAADGGTAETQKSTVTSHTVGGLHPASQYLFSVWAEKDGVNGSEVNITVHTAPGQVRGLRVEAQTSTSISLSWTSPDGPGQQTYNYWVRWPVDGGTYGTEMIRATSYTVGGLHPASQYEISVWAEKDGANGRKVTIAGHTAPNQVRALRVEAQTNMSISLSWTNPDGPGQQSYTYWVRWAADGGTAGTQKSTVTSHTVGGLHPESRYEFSVWAEKDGANGREVTIAGHTAPNEVAVLRNESRSNHSVTLQWEAPERTPGHNYSYSVRWATPGGPWGDENSYNTTERRFQVEGLLPGTLYTFNVSAQSQQVLGAPRSLQASTAPSQVTIISCASTSGGRGLVLTWSCPAGGYSAIWLEAGGQRSDQDQASCNASSGTVSGLQPAQTYAAHVVTVWDGELARSAPKTCPTESAGVIVGSVFGVLLFFLLVFLLVFFLKRRSLLPWPRSSKRAAPRSQAFSFVEDIPTDGFADHVRRNERDSNCGFAEEYQQLSLAVQNQPQLVASAPENSAKNRYRNVLPYDWSRVTLKPLPGEPGSDYINASFIPGLWSAQEFIATQGPLPQTVGDFWRLVWEQQSRTLVMLANCMETGRVKCEHYWPLNTKPCTHGSLQVTLISEEVTENWAVRSLQLRHVQEEKVLPVRQFHYLTWPDHGVPHSPGPMLAFWKVLRKWLDENVGSGPPIVHCSAGVGRTGTLIALDVLLRQLEAEGLVGTFNYVKKMRENRPLMVQTEAQYVFLHQCILRFLQESAAPPAQKNTYENLLYENITAI